MLRQRAVTLTIGLLMAAAFEPSAAFAEKHIALLMGNGAYTSLDAARIAKTPQASGFNDLSCDGNRLGCLDLTEGRAAKFPLVSTKPETWRSIG